MKINEFTLVITDISGQVVYKEFVNNENGTQSEISLSHLTKGMYMIHVKTNDSNFTEKLIIE